MNEDFAIFLIINQQISSTIKKHNTGSKIAHIVIRIDPKNSPVEIRKLITPPVAPDDAARRAMVPVCTIADAPPPAMIARDHFRNGEISTSMDAVTIVPAAIATGVMAASKIWSNNGI